MTARHARSDFLSVTSGCTARGTAAGAVAQARTPGAVRALWAAGRRRDLGGFWMGFLLAATILLVAPFPAAADWCYWTGAATTNYDNQLNWLWWITPDRSSKVWIDKAHVQWPGNNTTARISRNLVIENTGIVRVSDWPMRLETESLLVESCAGTAGLQITNEAWVYSSSAAVGAYDSPGSAELTNIGNWSISSNLHVGDGCSGALRVYSESDVVCGGDATIGRNGQGEVEVDGWSSSFDCYDLFLGRTTAASCSSTGSMKITDGGCVFVKGNAYIGSPTFNSGSGDMLITNTTVGPTEYGKLWVEQGDLYVGPKGPGTLNIFNGARATTRGNTYIGSGSGSPGSVVVADSGSLLATYCGLKVHSTGSLYVLSAGRVAIGTEDTYETTAPGQIKLGAGGCLTIDGGVVTCGSFDNAAGMPFEFTGGTLTIDGGAFRPGGPYDYAISGPDTPTVVLDNGASLTLPGDALDVSYSGDAATHGKGELIIRNGSTVSVDRTYIGHLNYSDGKATVSSGGTLTNWTKLMVGFRANSSGELAVNSGGRLLSGDSTVEGYIAHGPGSTGSVNVNGGTWNNSGSLYVGGNASSAGGTGTLSVSDGGAVNVGTTLKLWDDGTFNLTGGSVTTETLDLAAGTLNFTGGQLFADTVVGDLVVDGGELCPGCSPGTMSIDGNLTLSSGSILVELGGTCQGSEYDLLSVDGNLALGGELNVVLYDLGGGMFQPTEGDVFDILDWTGTVTGQFDTLNLPTLGGDLAWNTRDLYIDGTIGAVPEPATLSLLALGAIGLLRRKRYYQEHGSLKTTSKRGAAACGGGAHRTFNTPCSY